MPDFRGEFHLAGTWQPGIEAAPDKPARAISGGMYQTFGRVPFSYSTMLDDYVAATTLPTGNNPALYMRQRPLLYTSGIIGAERASPPVQGATIPITSPVTTARFNRGDVYRGG